VEVCSGIALELGLVVLFGFWDLGGTLRYSIGFPHGVGNGYALSF